MAEKVSEHHLESTKFMGTQKGQSAWSALCGGNPRNLGSLTQSWSESKYLPVPRTPTLACGYDFLLLLKMLPQICGLLRYNYHKNQKKR